MFYISDEDLVVIKMVNVNSSWLLQEDIDKQVEEKEKELKKLELAEIKKNKGKKKVKNSGLID